MNELYLHNGQHFRTKRGTYMIREIWYKGFTPSTIKFEDVSTGKSYEYIGAEFIEAIKDGKINLEK